MRIIWAKCPSCGQKLPFNKGDIKSMTANTVRLKNTTKCRWRDCGEIISRYDLLERVDSPLEGKE